MESASYAAKMDMEKQTVSTTREIFIKKKNNQSELDKFHDESLICF